VNPDGCCILAIDNGLTGGLALLSCVPGLAPVRLVSMPARPANLYHREVSKKKASGKVHREAVKDPAQNEIDAVALAAIIRGFGVAKIRAVIFEGCPDHAQQKSTMKSMANSDGKVMAVLELLGLAPNTYRILSHTWQGKMLGKVPAGRTKEYAVAAAQSIWPAQNWMRTPRCSKPEMGWVDAALIGMWGLRHIPGLAEGLGVNAPLVQMLGGFEP
jgi:hypothetical protein